jgi:hypothetical protein
VHYYVMQETSMHDNGMQETSMHEVITVATFIVEPISNEVTKEETVYTAWNGTVEDTASTTVITTVG